VLIEHALAGDTSVLPAIEERLPDWNRDGRAARALDTLVRVSNAAAAAEKDDD